MKAYTVHYKLDFEPEVKSVSFLAKNKKDALEKAQNEIIPDMEKDAFLIESWVYSVTYQNGNQKIFK
jgi:hypothetical protein